MDYGIPYFRVCANHREFGSLAFLVSCCFWFDVCALAEGYIELGRAAEGPKFA